MALRLQGTSIKDMQEAGEEIDGLIETQSKLRQTILDATKVASNNYMGFDIQEMNGSYKTTYQMLKGIADIYQEIGKEDKKRGTNRQAFILETVAGKTRAAAASSILSNPQILEEVFEQAFNSEGSAQKELDKYLESIEGRTQRLQNHLQELAATTIDTDWLKAGITALDKIIELVTLLSDKLGGVKLIVSSILGTFAGFSGHGKQKITKQVSQKP